VSMVMKYKGYVGKVDYDEHEHAFVGLVVNTRDVITFVGETATELEEALRDSIEDYLSWCAERGEAPDKPYSGQFMVRLEPDLHAKIVLAAAERDVSLNEFVRLQLESAVAARRVTPPTRRGRRRKAKRQAA
jgi:predicted HicB family RNase H-like nuclease